MTRFLLTIGIAIAGILTLNGQTFCGEGLHAIEGLVADACDAPIVDLEIIAEDMNGVILDSATTDAFGFYSLCIEAGETVTVSPVSPNDYLNGVSTFDEVIMRRHILGQELFEFPLQHISADVNATQSITALDIVQVEKLILQEILEFENSPSWKYVANADDLTLETAFEAEFTYVIEEINSIQVEIDFTGVKMGDVNQLGCNAAVTNIENITLVNEIEIAPNPMSESTTVSFTLTGNSEIEILISDVLGREIFRSIDTYHGGSHEFQISSQTLPKRGVYLVSLSDGKSQLTKRLIKNN